MRIIMYFVALMTSLCSFAGDRRATTTLGSLKKAGLPMDVVVEWFQPSLNGKTRKVQQLIDDICGTRTLECDLHDKDIVDIDGVVWPLNLLSICLFDNKIANLSQKNLNALPTTLKRLDLNDNELNLLKNVKFPNNIETLCMRRNDGLRFDHVRLPNNLKELFLSNSQLTYDSINWQSLSKLDHLCIQNNGILFNDHDVVRFPESLRELIIDYETLDSIIRNEERRGDGKFNANLHNLKTLHVVGGSRVSRQQVEDVKSYFSNLPNCQIDF